MHPITRFEHKGQKVIPRYSFAIRMARAIGLWAALTVGGLAIGMAGYAITEGMGFADAFVNAAMILSGMGPVSALHTTAGKIFAGFYAIVQGMNHDYEKAAVAIFVAMVLDSLDGRVARLTRTQSAFGAEYDSLTDMVSFGAAPALIMYEWALRDLGRVGWIAAFVYCAGAALRLARFNTQLSVADKRWFTGLPSPAAAGTVARARPVSASRLPAKRPTRDKGVVDISPLSPFATNQWRKGRSAG